VVSPAAVDNAIINISNSYKAMEISISRPLGSNATLCVNSIDTTNLVIIQVYIIKALEIKCFLDLALVISGCFRSNSSCSCNIEGMVNRVGRHSFSERGNEPRGWVS